MKARSTLSWLMRGNMRRKVYAQLSDTFISCHIRGQLAKKRCNVSTQDFRRHLRAFEKHGLVVCKTPRLPFNKIYALTAKGKSHQAQLKQASRTLKPSLR